MNKKLQAFAAFLVVFALVLAFFVGRLTGYHDGWKAGFHDSENVLQTYLRTR